MPKKTVKVSVKPLKIFFILLAIIVVAGLIYFARSKSKSAPTEQAGSMDNQQEIVLPSQTGVADSGFEQKNSKLSVLNTKAVFDTIEQIDGISSLKISFSDRPNASAAIKDYFDDIETDGFYRLSFWAKTETENEKTVNINLVDGDQVQNLGSISLNQSKSLEYYEFNFQAENNAADLVLNSEDGGAADVWVDNFLAEKLDVNSQDELNNLKPTIFGDTTRKNVNQSQTEDDNDSGDFLATPKRKVGQIFQPAQAVISGDAFKILKVGNGGEGNYQIQLREYDEKLGVIGSEPLATRNIYTGYSLADQETIKKKEQQMRGDFDQTEKDITSGKTENDPTVGQYPATFTQQQIDADKAQKRKDKLEMAIRDMKASFNAIQELEIPIAAKLDPNKKYWIGIDNSAVKVDRENYIKIFYNSKLKDESEAGFASTEPNVWQEYYTLWFKTFYPLHNQIQGQEILSGATISDFGNKFLYRYQFNAQDYAALSGFPGRKIYDMDSGNFGSSDIYANYKLSGPDDYAIYKFNTLYPTEKITIQNGFYHQSLAIEFSTDGENWKEVYSENPSENGQTINPFVINPEEKSPVFYLKIKPAGNDCILFDLSLEAELASN